MKEKSPKEISALFEEVDTLQSEIKGRIHEQVSNSGSCSRSDSKVKSSRSSRSRSKQLVTS